MPNIVLCLIIDLALEFLHFVELSWLDVVAIGVKLFLIILSGAFNSTDNLSDLSLGIL